MKPPKVFRNWSNIVLFSLERIKLTLRYRKITNYAYFWYFNTKHMKNKVVVRSLLVRVAVRVTTNYRHVLDYQRD